MSLSARYGSDNVGAPCEFRMSIYLKFLTILPFVLGQYLNHPGVAFCTKLTTDENDITNAVDIYHNPRQFIRSVKVEQAFRVV